MFLNQSSALSAIFAIAPWIVLTLLLLLIILGEGDAEAAPPPETTIRVLDVEKRRAVSPSGREFDAGPTCDVLVVGGGLGGVAAAETLARHGYSVILSEPTTHLGGQLTAQAVPVPDENRFIEQEGGPSTRNYRQLREQVRGQYAKMPGIRPGREKNVGQCWVSRVSGEPAIWEAAIGARLAPLTHPRGIRRILMRHQLLQIARYPGNNRVAWADFLDLDSGAVTRVGAQFVLDATEWGDALALAGSPFQLGQESKAEYGEPRAPDAERPDWVQSFTYCFAVRWTPGGGPVIEKPAEYEYFKSLGEYTLNYEYVDRGTVPYKMFATAPGAGGPFWTYRRLIAASSFDGTNPAYTQDLSLINWRGNDFHEESPVGKSVDEQVRILERGKAFAQGFLYWLQTECPRDDGNGTGYPEMQLDIAALGTADGFAAHPYIRESRRLEAEFTLTEQHLTADPAQPDRKIAANFPDSVGTALYAIDIHPSKGEPPLLTPALPYTIPLGAFLPRSGPPNIIPAAKNFGATRLALASARMHPTEWLAGEVAGNLAAFCLKNKIDQPTQVRADSALLTQFQEQLSRSGVTLRWPDPLP